MSAETSFEKAVSEMPLIPVLRGISPEDVLPITDALYEAGFRIAEVTLNSPRPYDSIELMAKSFGERMLIGAGTVLTAEEVGAVQAAGGALIVSPDMNPVVITQTRARGMVSLPGVATPTEAFSALRAGAHGLKVFPAEMIPPTVIKAMRAILPKGLPLFAVGGISQENLQSFLEMGATGVGLGSSLYRPGIELDDFRAVATSIAKAYRQFVSESGR